MDWGALVETVVGKGADYLSQRDTAKRNAAADAYLGRAEAVDSPSGAAALLNPQTLLLGIAAAAAITVVLVVVLRR
jgi:hypothetical protein